ncbi:EAP30/Vps36 family-domain-containing protein [Umbelopsis sp. PMI_123]|nr:EAP30/Vps36 family-domain-containing protein [Umbelopsis sp. PMI_123]
MRRRAVGFANAENRQAINRKFQEIGDNIAAREIQQLHDQLDTFKTNLQEFARKYRKDIRRDPTFRMHFQQMCTKIGVDPLASNKGFWADLLGFGDFYFELSVQITEICIATRPQNGGLIEMGELKRRIKAKRGDRKSSQQEISEDDIVRSIKTLKPLSSGFEILMIGNRKMVRSVPKELDTDQSSLLLLAQANGYMTKGMIENELKWHEGRTQQALDNLLQDGLAWLDLSEGEEDRYWIPSFYNFGDSENTV